MSNFLTQFSSGSVAMDIDVIAMAITVIAVSVLVSKGIGAKSKGDTESAQTFLAIAIVASVPYALTLAVYIALSLTSDASLTDTQSALLMAVVIASFALITISVVRSCIRVAKVARDSDV